MKLILILFLSFVTSITQAQLLDVFASKKVTSIPDSANYYSFASGDVISIPHSTQTELATSDFSIEIICTITNQPAIVSLYDKTDTGDDGARIYVVSGKVWGSVNAVDVKGTLTVYDGLVKHIVFTADRDGWGRVYVNGSQDGSTVSISSSGVMSTTVATKIGNSTPSNYPMVGSMRLFRIYPKALSPAEVTTLYNGGTVDGAIVDLNGDNSHVTATTWFDATANHNDGTVTGATKVEALK